MEHLEEKNALGIPVCRVTKIDTTVDMKAFEQIVKGLLGKPLCNLLTGEVALVNKKQSKKMLSEKAVSKSIKNGFAFQQQQSALMKLRRIWAFSAKAAVHPDEDSPFDVTVGRYVSPVETENQKQAFLWITARSSANGGVISTRIYSIELMDEKKLRSIMDGGLSMVTNHAQNFGAAGNQVTSNGTGPRDIPCPIPKLVSYDSMIAILNSPVNLKNVQKIHNVLKNCLKSQNNVLFFASDTSSAKIVSTIIHHKIDKLPANRNLNYFVKHIAELNPDKNIVLVLGHNYIIPKDFLYAKNIRLIQPRLTAKEKRSGINKFCQMFVSREKERSGYGVESILKQFASVTRLLDRNTIHEKNKHPSDKEL